MNPTSRLCRLIASGTLLTLLAACGGSGGEPATMTGSGGTASGAAPTAIGETASGTITGFGSVIVDGVRYDDSSARIKIEDDSSSPGTGSLTDLKLGMQVEVTADASGRAGMVSVLSSVHGRVTALRADGFIVAGQTVMVSADAASPIVWDGLTGLADLAVNDRVEVHGRRDPAGAIVATRVERKDPSSAVAVRVLGSVANLDAAAKTFTVGGLTVRYDSVLRLLPTGVTLADGQTVAVWSNLAVVGNTLDARAIVVRRGSWNRDDALRVGGLIRGLDFAARRFRLDTLEVDASAATFEKGTANDLADGRAVRVRGSFVDGRLLAREVRFVRDQDDAKVELTGPVTDFTGLASFKVRGVPVDASGSSVSFRYGTAANLGDGVLVKIEGAVDGNVVRPTRIEFVTSDDVRGRWLVGSVAGFDAASGAFRLMNLEARLTDTTTFSNADGSAASRADFGNGDLVQVRGAFAGGVFTVTEVRFRSGPTLVVNNVEGSAYEVDLSAGRFRLNGTLVQVGPTTVVQGSLANLRNGTKVEVYGTVVAGVLVASKVEVKTPEGVDTARVRGMIGDFMSVSDFRVAGQKVDASAARFEPAGITAASLANGRFAEVRGAVVDGVLRATKVELK